MVVTDIAWFEVNVTQTVKEPGPQVDDVMQMRGIRRQCRVGGDHGGKLFVRDVDEGDGLVGDRGALRGNSDDRLAHEADAVDGEDRPILQGVTVVGVDRRQIAARHHRDHAGERFGTARVDAGDAGVGVRAAQEPAVGHPVQAEIARELGLARHLGDGVDARRVMPDGGERRWRRRNRAHDAFAPAVGGGESLGGVRNGVEDIPVARAAAEIPAQVILDLRACRSRVLGQQRFGGENEPRCAKPALDRHTIDERLLDRVEPVRTRQTFDRLDLPAVGLVGERAARAHGRAVEEDGAGATDLRVARTLGAGQPEIVAQDIEQNRPRFDLDRNRPTVHGRLKAHRRWLSYLRRHGGHPPRRSRAEWRRPRPGGQRCAPSWRVYAADSKTSPLGFDFIPDDVGREGCRCRYGGLSAQDGLGFGEPLRTLADAASHDTGAGDRAVVDRDHGGDRRGRPLMELEAFVGVASVLRFKLHERPTAAVAAVIAVDDGTITDARIVAGSVGERPQRLSETETILRGQPAEGSTATIAAEVIRDEVETGGDVFESEAYTRQLARTVGRRAVAAAIQCATGEEGGRRAA